MIRRIKALTDRDDIDPGLAINAFNECPREIPLEFYGQIVGSARIIGQGGEPDEQGRTLQRFLVLELSIPQNLVFQDVFLECDYPDSVAKVVLLDSKREEEIQGSCTREEFQPDRDRRMYPGTY